MSIRGVTNDILGLAMHATALRDRVLNHNITNNETPEYKKYEVFFEESLAKVREDYNKTGKLDVSAFNIDVRKINTTLSHRIDGNNVDINEENSMLYRNATIYDMIVNSYMKNKELFSTIYNNLK